MAMTFPVSRLTSSILAGVLLCAVGAAEQPTGDRAPSPSGRLVDVGGYRLHINCAGEGGPAVVLLAGGGDFSFDWGLVQPDVARFARVCSYDRAGTAWSDPGPTPRTMRQEAHELHTLLKNAGVDPPYVLVGHSFGGLIARVYADQFPREVAGMVLVDPTHEDTTLIFNGKLVRIRDHAKGVPIPPVQTIESSPPRPPTAEDLEQHRTNLQVFGPPKTEPPFDKLPPAVQAARLWFRSQPPRAAAGQDFWADELQAIYTARAKVKSPLGDIPLAVIVTKPAAGAPPPGIAADDWKRVADEKWRQKDGLKTLSRKGRLIVAERSGHHVQLDEPRVVTDAIRTVVDEARRAGKSRRDGRK